MKKRFLPFLILPVIGLLTGCFFLNPNVSPITVDEGIYETRNVDVYRRKGVAGATFPVRFYQSSPHVPYVGIGRYFKMFFSISLRRTSLDKGYSYYLAGNAYVKALTDSNEFIVSGFDYLGSNPDFGTVSAKTFIIDGEANGVNPEEKTFYLNNYSMDIYLGSDDAYVPLGLLSNLFGGTSLFNIIYNGQDIYEIDMNGQLSNGVSRTVDYYGESYYQPLKRLVRYEDMVEFNYNLLCLTFDNCRGYTEQMVFGDEQFRAYGFDSFLSREYPQIKENLLSTSNIDYQKGLLALFTGLYDGGHTGLLSSTYPDRNYASSLLTDESLSSLVNKYKATTNNFSNSRALIQKTRKEAFNVSTDKYYLYDSEHKTSYIGFDSFDYDYEGWNEYYTKKGRIPVESDTYAYVRDKLHKAKSDGAKNVILDISNNTGGALASLIGIASLFHHAEASYRMHDVLDGSKIETKIYVDTNLDGKYNTLDIKECDNFNFKIAVITSCVSFSCGNLLPFLMKEYGYKIIGEKSGGGSCAITTESTADGAFYVRSSSSTLCDASFNNVDGGMKVDVDLLGNNDGEKSYDRFFDFDSIEDIFE